MKLAGGFYWPEGHEQNNGLGQISACAAITSQIQECVKLAHLLPPTHRHTVVQAGGNIGVFPKTLSSWFKSVLTFEPDPENWECLVSNLNGVTNVRCVPAALGHRIGTAPLLHHVGHSGRSHLVRPGLYDTDKLKADGYYTHTQTVDVVMLDNFSFIACDLLQLDVEGFELYALRGAVDTIAKHRPVIVVEIIADCIERHGSTKEAIDLELAGLGYVGYPNRTINSHNYVYSHKDSPKL
jgi:FkbM family methyltransferase